MLLALLNHDILLLKLKFYGITDEANEWIKSYLKNRYQRVEIKKQKLQSQCILELGDYKTWCSAVINFRSLTFSSLYK
jgi:hypothetical protein